MRTYKGESQENARDCCFTVYDKVRVKVDVTTEFPLDIKCSLLLTEEDQAVYEDLQEAPKTNFSAGEVPQEIND